MAAGRIINSTGAKSFPVTRLSTKKSMRTVPVQIAPEGRNVSPASGSTFCHVRRYRMAIPGIRGVERGRWLVAAEVFGCYSRELFYPRQLASRDDPSPAEQGCGRRPPGGAIRLVVRPEGCVRHAIRRCGRNFGLLRGGVRLRSPYAHTSVARSTHEWLPRIRRQAPTLPHPARAAVRLSGRPARSQYVAAVPPTTSRPCRRRSSQNPEAASR